MQTTYRVLIARTKAGARRFHVVRLDVSAKQSWIRYCPSEFSQLEPARALAARLQSRHIQ